MPEEHVTEIERDLAALLALEPSAHFSAGVREQLAAAPGPRWLSLRAWAAAAALVTLAVAIGAMAMRGRSEPAAEVAAPPPPSIASPAGERQAAPRLPRPSPPQHRPVGLTARVAATKEPAFVVDPELAVAMRRLFTMAQSRTADEVLATAGARSIADPPEDLGVAPVVIGDLPVKSIQGVERR